jgi:hypothetical protein
MDTPSWQQLFGIAVLKRPMDAITYHDLKRMCSIRQVNIPSWIEYVEYYISRRGSIKSINNITMNMLKDATPFDMEKARAGETLVTRNGQPVTEFHWFGTTIGDCCAVAVITGKLHQFTFTGKCQSYKDDTVNSGYDLLMAPVLVKTYQRVYPNRVSTVVHSNLEDTRAKASDTDRLGYLEMTWDKEGKLLQVSYTDTTADNW